MARHEAYIFLDGYNHMSMASKDYEKYTPHTNFFHTKGVYSDSRYEHMLAFLLDCTMLDYFSTNQRRKCSFKSGPLLVIAGDLYRRSIDHIIRG